MPGPPRCLRLRHSPAGGAFGAVEAELDQTFVDDVGTDLALAAVDPLFDLRQVVVDEAWSPSGTGQCQPRVTGGDVAPDGFRIDTGQLCGGMRAAGRVVGFENFHDVPVRLLHASLRWESLGGGRRPRAKPRRGVWFRTDTPPAPRPSTGRSAVRQQGQRCPSTGRLACPLSLGWKVGSATGGGRDRTGVTGRSRGAGRSPPGCTPVPARSCPPVNSRSSPAGEHLQQLPAGGYRSMNSSVEIGRYCDDDKGRGGCAARRGRNAHPSRLPDAPGPDDDATGTGVSISRLPGHWSSIRGHNLVPDRGREHS